MTEPLATSDDVVERLGRALTSAESNRIDALILDASGSVIAYTGQTFVLEETTALLPIRNGAIRLPLRPVTAVDMVEDGNSNALTFTWIDGDSTISLSSHGYLNEWELNIPAGTRVSKASVTYTHGWEPIPDDVIGVVCQIVGRALGTPSTESGMTSETIANYSYSLGSAAGAGPFGMLSDEKRILDRYRVLAGPIPVI